MWKQGKQNWGVLVMRDINIYICIIVNKHSKIALLEPEQSYDCQWNPSDGVRR